MCILHRAMTGIAHTYFTLQAAGWPQVEWKGRIQLQRGVCDANDETVQNYNEDL